MQLNFTKDGKYKVMAQQGNLKIVYVRFDTLAEAEFEIECKENDSNPVNREVNAGWKFWIEVEE